MSNMPLIPPILPLVDDDANAPEPESERADAIKARRAEKLIDGEDLLDPADRADGLLSADDDEVDVEIAAAKKREGKV